MKKIISFVLALSCILVLFASCGTNNAVPNDNSKTTNTSQESSVSTPVATETEGTVPDVTSERKVYPIRAEIYRKGGACTVLFISEDISYRELFSDLTDEQIESEKELCQSVGLEFKTSIYQLHPMDMQLDDKIEFNYMPISGIWRTAADAKYSLATKDIIQKLTLRYGKKNSVSYLRIFPTESQVQSVGSLPCFYISEIIDKTTE